MDRRNFLRKAGIMSAALTSATSARGGLKREAHAAPVEPGGAVTLTNDALVWRLEWRKRRLGSSRFENKLSGRAFPLSSAQEIVLTFSASKHRVEIPWWRFAFGPDQTSVLPAQEQGFRLGYHLPDFSDRGWGATENLLLRSLRGVKRHDDGITYDGFGWFRCWFELPKDAEGETIILVLGGHDCQDWNEYWVYLNGAEIGHRLSSGRWRSPGQFSIARGSPGYSSLRFDGGAKNLLAVRTRGYDKHFGGLSDEVLKHYVFEPVLVDQFISVGEPYLRVSDFEVQELSRTGDDEATFELRSVSEPISASAHYELRGPTRRKWLEIKNQSGKEMVLLDVQLDDFTLDASTSEGGPGEPVFVGEEAFCAIEHPAGVNQGSAGRVFTVHFPARSLPPATSTHSHVSLLGVGKAGQALEAFVSYIQANSPRKKKAISIYDPFGINNQWGGCPTLNDAEMLDGLKVLEKWREKGLQFEYYVPDYGWVDHASDLTRFAPECFPNGPTIIVERVRELGMKFGLWFGVSWGAASCSEYPPAWACQIPALGESSEPGVPAMVYRNGYLADGGVPMTLCPASEPYFSILRNAILYHIRENNLKFFKLDGGSYYCNSTRHNHLPGKYSVEAMYDRLIDIASSAREAVADIYVMWYWGVRSPFFALHGDSVFESGLYMEGSATSWIPTLYYRDSVTLNLDQSTQFAKTIPPINKDSLGIWLADTRWGNFMGNERWKEALIMDLGRGNLLFPQLWGDVYLLNQQDVDFLVGIDSLVKKNEAVFLSHRSIVGDPWRNEVYGYAYFQGTHGFLFINNVHFISRKLNLHLGSTLGIEGETGTPVQVISHFPDRTRLVQKDGSRFKIGDRPEFWLRPFEVLMLEVLPDKGAAESLPAREVSSQQAADLGISLGLEPVPFEDWMGVRFADMDRFEKEGQRKSTYTFACQLPSLEGDPPILAVAVRLSKGGAEWRYSPVVVEIVQVVAHADGRRIQLIPVPDARQYGNTQKAGSSWIVYKTRLNRHWSQKELRFAVHAYLPERVEPQIDAWVVKQWWKEKARPSADGYFADEPS